MLSASPDIISLICSYCHPVDVAYLRAACKTLHSTMKDEGVAYRWMINTHRYHVYQLRERMKKNPTKTSHGMPYIPWKRRLKLDFLYEDRATGKLWVLDYADDIFYRAMSEFAPLEVLDHLFQLVPVTVEFLETKMRQAAIGSPIFDWLSAKLDLRIKTRFNPSVFSKKRKRSRDEDDEEWLPV